MRGRPHDVKAAKPTVSLTVNSDLQVEIRQDLEAASSYMAKHGSFAEMVRQHYLDSDEG